MKCNKQCDLHLQTAAQINIYTLLTNEGKACDVEEGYIH